MTLFRQLVAVLGAVFCAAGCASTEGPVAGFAQDFESQLFEATAPSAAIEVLVNECARANGLEGWVEGLSRPSPRLLDPAPGLVGEERLREIGSGLVAGSAIAAELRNAEAPEKPPAPAEDESRVLDQGPVVVADGQFDGGCRQWASEAVLNSDSQVESQRAADAYSEYLADALAGSSDVAELHERWSRCMAEAGFQGLLEPGNQLDDIRERVAEWESGRITYDEALAFDIAVTVAASDCSVDVRPAIAAIRDQIAFEYTQRD